MSKFTTFLCVVIFSGALLVAGVVVGHPIASWSVVAVLAALTFLAEWFSVSLPVAGSGSLAFAVNLAAILLAGPGAGALVAMAGSVSRQDVVERKPPLTIAFNVAQLGGAAAAAGLVYESVGGVPALGAGGQPPSIWLGLLTALVLASVNVSVVAMAISLKVEAPFRRVLKASFGGQLLSLAAMSLLGLVMAQLVRTAGLGGLAVLVLPFAVARLIFAVTERQSVAYIDTIRALATAMEEKDPYTRGHAERVAWYCRHVGEKAGLTSGELEILQRAALLHDIGKVACSSKVLNKAGRLTPAEYEEIMEHPELAAAALEGIELLSDAISLIREHHQRPDGSGYPADAAPSSPLSCLLAVADSFDAMTSDRPYRSALNYESAIAELVANRGSQFDPDSVGSFVSAVDEMTVMKVLQRHPSSGVYSGADLGVGASEV